MNREYKEQLSRQIERNYSDLEMRIMQDIVRRIKKAGKITSTADWQINRLRILGNSSEDIEKMLKEALNASYPQMFELYDKVITGNMSGIKTFMSRSMRNLSLMRKTMSYSRSQMH